MKIVAEKPPAWIMDGCMNQFRINVEHTFWTYGDTIFNPGGHPIPDHIVAHEERHSLQQAAYEEHELDGKGAAVRVLAKGKDAWWRRYLTDPRFRLEQEADAYGAQLRFFAQRVRDRNKQAYFATQLAQQLSGPLYQVAVDQAQARRMIQVLAGLREL